MLAFNSIVRYIQELNIAHKSSNKSFINILNDFFSLNKRKGILWGEYFSFHFETKSDEFKNSFLGVNEQRFYLDYLNPKKYYTAARNKYFSHLLLNAAGIKNKAELLCCYLPESKIESNNDIGYDYNTVKDILIKKRVTECVIKSPETSHGDNVYLITDVKYHNDYCVLIDHHGNKIELRELLSTMPLIFENRIRQTNQFCRFNPSSVNTIRFMTTLYPDRTAKIIATFIKIGRSGNCVDNAGKGGNVDAAVDINTGRLYNVIQFDGWHNIKQISRHPDNNYRLDGVIIEHWEEIKQKVITFQQSFPWIKAAGWDIAITDNGPYIIEVNDFWDRTGQLFIGKGWRDEIRDCYNSWKCFNAESGVNYDIERGSNRLNIKRLNQITKQ